MLNIKSFDPKTLNMLRGELAAVLEKFGVSEGLDFKVGKMKYSQVEVSIEVKATISGAKTRSDTMLEARVASLGLKMENAKGWKLVEYRPSNWKFPFIFTKPDGKTYKASDDHVKAFFK